MKAIWPLAIIGFIAIVVTVTVISLVQSAPEPVIQPHAIQDWDGSKFLSVKDVEAMGGDARSPEPIAYKREGPAHVYQIGLGELEVKIWAYVEEASTVKKIAGERGDDVKACEALKGMKRATVAEVVDEGSGYRRNVLRSDGWGVSTATFRTGRFVAKVMRADACRQPSDLSGVIERCKKAADHIRAKLVP